MLLKPIAFSRPAPASAITDMPSGQLCPSEESAAGLSRSPTSKMSARRSWAEGLDCSAMGRSGHRGL